ncbi:LacI family DNA-binding transcriptional regulator [Arthrobacter sp. ATA002]|uniref:LacI family DNA-binding transcriptional regulator n=1 Tax=Arthrobacter sp. ATA002 TaxID=2991715 RepID=UPI0022A6E5C8|nr:LacI family DNA-binding transcriptional regulator [Arthrobacter sp. ATA002]WAP51520.1 LacI family DNA-binding transcriptional regulator [Arthrobacter sp. ATA002]
MTTDTPTSHAAAGSSRMTISAIAASIGVSVPSVSKVLNGRSDVAPATRRKIEKALQEHNYQRNARQAGSSAARLIELVFHELDSAWSIEIIRGVEQAARRNGMGVVLSDLGGSHSPDQRWMREVIGRRPHGIILVQSTLTPDQKRQLETRSIPYVVLDTNGETNLGAPAVGSNNWHGGLSATRHLLALGHRRIAVVSGPEDVLCSRARVDGYRAAHAEAGISPMEDSVRWGNFTVVGGYEHGRELLARPERPTAIFAGSDMQALGVLRAAREQGIEVPAQLSVVGYDDLPLAEWVGPSLTTVNQPLLEMADAAASMVLGIARGTDPKPRSIELATELVVRESTGPVPEQPIR